jgi:hypothetical protein
LGSLELNGRTKVKGTVKTKGVVEALDVSKATGHRILTSRIMMMVNMFRLTCVKDSIVAEVVIGVRDDGVRREEDAHFGVVVAGIVVEQPCVNTPLFAYSPRKMLFQQAANLVGHLDAAHGTATFHALVQAGG